MFNDFKSPAAFADRKLMGCAVNAGPDGRYTEGLLKLPCPSVDYVAPEFIDLLITDTGGYTPLYIYRLLSEYYTREDYVLSKELLNKMTGH
jgi:translation initiation factor eIF-2B subunit beta